MEESFKQLKIDDEIDGFHHYNNGVYIHPNGGSKDIVTCWCLIHRIFKDEELIKEVIKKDDELYCYRLLNVTDDIPVNKIISRALRKTIRGPVFLRCHEKDIDRKVILDYLISC